MKYIVVLFAFVSISTGLCCNLALATEENLHTEQDLTKLLEELDQVPEEIRSMMLEILLNENYTIKNHRGSSVKDQLLKHIETLKQSEGKKQAVKLLRSERLLPSNQKMLLYVLTTYDNAVKKALYRRGWGVSYGKYSAERQKKDAELLGVDPIYLRTRQDIEYRKKWFESYGKYTDKHAVEDANTLLFQTIIEKDKSLPLNLQKTKKFLSKKYGNHPIPLLLNLEQSYQTLPKSLQKVVKRYFGIKE